jgi:hypothetical protein
MTGINEAPRADQKQAGGQQEKTRQIDSKMA